MLRVVGAFFPSATAVNQVTGLGGFLTHVHVFNPETSALFLQVFNALSSNVVLGSTTAALVLNIQSGGASDVGSDVDFGTGIRLADGITFGLTQTPTGATLTTSCATVSITYG